MGLVKYMELTRQKHLLFVQTEEVKVWQSYHLSTQATCTEGRLASRKANKVLESERPKLHSSETRF